MVNASVVYFDSSAAVKLILPEPDTEYVQNGWLGLPIAIP